MAKFWQHFASKMEPDAYKNMIQLSREESNFPSEANDHDALTLTTLSTRTSAASSAYFIQQVCL